MVKIEIGVAYVLADRREGICKFYGSTDFAKGKWVGLEITKGKGKHDGTVRGKKYFKCKAGKGTFVKDDKVSKRAKGSAKAAQPSRKRTPTKGTGQAARRQPSSRAQAYYAGRGDNQRVAGRAGARGGAKTKDTKKKGKTFSPGDKVQVFSKKSGKWLDAEIVSFNKKAAKYTVKLGSKEAKVPRDRLRPMPADAPAEEKAEPAAAPADAAAPAAVDKQTSFAFGESWKASGEAAEAQTKPITASKETAYDKRVKIDATRVKASASCAAVVKRFFSFYDKDGNGFLEEDECVKIFKGWGNSKKVAKTMFADMLKGTDDDSDGKISVDEYFEYFTANMKTPDDIDAAGNLSGSKMSTLTNFADMIGLRYGATLVDDPPPEVTLNLPNNGKEEPVNLSTRNAISFDDADILTQEVSSLPDLPRMETKSEFPDWKKNLSPRWNTKPTTAGDEDQKDGVREANVPMVIPRSMSEDARIRFTEAQSGKKYLLIVAGGHESMMSMKGAMEKPTDSVEGFYTADATWKELAKIPGGPRSGMGYCTYQGKFTIMGGWKNQMFEAMCDDILQYDHVADSWSEIGKLPAPIWGLRAVEFDGKLVISGGKLKDKVETETTVSSWDGSAWENLPDMSKGRAKHCMAVVDGNIVVAGGMTNMRNSHAETHCEVLKGGKWDRLPKMNSTRACMGWCIYEDKLTVVGGRNDDGATDTVESLNMGRMEWKKMSRMLNPRTDVVAASLNNHLFVVGGDAIMTGGATRKTAEYYDEENWKWFLLPPAMYKRACAANCCIDLS